MTFLAWSALVTTISNVGRPKLVNVLPKALGRYCIGMSLILSTGQGQAKVTKGHQNQRNRVTHVIWPILLVDFNGSNIFDIWPLGQVKKGQIRSNFQNLFFDFWTLVSDDILSPDSNGVIYFCVWRLEMSKKRNWKLWRHILVCIMASYGGQK